MATATESPRYKLAARVFDDQHAVVRLAPTGPWHEQHATRRDAARQHVADTLVAVQVAFADSPAAKELANLRDQHAKAVGAARAASAQADASTRDRAAALVAGKGVDEAEAKIVAAKADAAKYNARANDLVAMIATAGAYAKAQLMNRLTAALDQMTTDKHSASQAADRALSETIGPLVDAAFQGQVDLEEANNVRNDLASFAKV